MPHPKWCIVQQCGHAKAYYQKSVQDIKEMNAILEEKHIPEVSIIAEKDGAECIAEVEVMLYRKEKVPDETLKLYNEYVKGTK